MDKKIKMNKVSYYYKYNFTSPEVIYTELKEELKSYFLTGVIDDVLFPRYTEDCLKRLGKGSLKIEENVFCLEDFEAKLPANFEDIRELWLTTPQEISYKMPNSHYEQSTFKVSAERERCDDKFCAPDEVKVTYKTSGKVVQKFRCHHLLKPGNVNAQGHLSQDNWNIFAESLETFDIRNNKIVTNFPTGTLYAVYYVKDYDDNDYQLVPDNIRIKDYIKAYLKYKCFEIIYNNISDETLKQIEGKLRYYEMKADEAKVMAELEIRKQTVHQQIRATKSARKRLQKYNIS